MGAAAPAPAPAEDAFPAAEAPAAEGAGAPIPLVTFSARYISLLEALNIVTKVAGLKYRIESSVVMIVPLDTPEDVLIHGMYDVLPTFIEKVTAVAESGGAGGGAAGGGVGEFRAMDGTAVSTDRGDLKDVFTQLGVPWPKGSQIRHLPAIGKLNVVNTPDNIALFEGILAVLNVVPSQIEIEARFVEIRQTDSDSLGIEWLLNADWNLLQKKGQEHLPLNQRELIRMNANANSGGFTKGNRYVSDANLPQSVTFFDSMVGSVGTGASVADELFTLSGILTDPQLSMVLHALEQKGNADVLSAPKVTTQSGAEATIKVVTEYIYPTEYTVTPITGTTGTSGTSTIMGGIVEPGGFETREVGVILTVVPEVTPDGSMINLTMSPQVVGDPVWHDYGSTYTDGTTTQRMKMEMPFFHTRTITTSISIFNGATVVMGGMITENRNDVEDKIPFLGDIPLLGRLFTSRMEHAEKNNLLIFVTARQVDPAGRVLKRSSGLPGQSTPATPAAK
jgi:general secretion pathway protein D